MDQGYEVVVEQIESVQDEQRIVELAPEVLDRIGGGTILCIL